MKFEITSRWTGNVLFSVETDSWKLALEAAVGADADLGGANLRGANLGGANLGGANLRDANLGDANLRGANLGDANLGDANLRGANLRGANLGGANLGGANLRDANLGGANLGGANLGGANLGGANLGGANLRGADLGDANLGDANLGGADLGDMVSKYCKVDNLHTKMLAAIGSSGSGLDMSTWHSCETTHCRAGWCVELAGPAGKILEACMGSSAAGALITAVSCPWLERTPDWYASDETAIADIRACAEKEAELAAKAAQ